MKRYGYFLGCVMPVKMPWAEKAVMLVARHLGLYFDYLRSTTCCIRPGVWKALDYNAWLTLTSYNLALAEEQKVILVDSCNGCWISHYEALQELREDPEKRELVASYLKGVGKPFPEHVEVRHFLQVLYEDVGLEEIKRRVKRRLNFKATRHIGCHARKLGDDVLPRYFDETLEALGVEIVDTPYDRMCCGLLLFLADPERSVYERIERKLNRAYDLGVDLCAMICSGCYDQFDRAIRILRREAEARGVAPKACSVPVVHLAELLALAFGYKPEDFGMQRFRCTPVDSLLDKLQGKVKP